MKELKYPHLFSPLKIRGIMMKNRIITGGAGVPKAYVLSSTNYGQISAFDRSMGGAAIISNPVYGWDLPKDPFDKYGRDSTREILSVMRQNGSLAMIGCGPMGMAKDGSGLRLDPSDGITQFLNPGREATKEELKDCIETACKKAARIVDFGFDVIQVGLGGESLCAKFLSPVWNKRTDEYGGSLENRCRFAVEWAKALRETVGPDFPLIGRVSRTLGPVPETWSEDDCVYYISQLAPYIDGFIMNNGADTYGGTIDKYECNVHGQTTVFEPRYYNLAFAERVKKEVGTIVFVSGGVGGDPQIAEDLIAEGKIDGICMVRSMFADPYWPEKALEGKAEDIVPCIKCLNCYHISTVHENVQCSVNPRFRRENRVPLKLEKTENPQNVVVIGAGPAGCRAAMAAAEKGHNVTIIEKDSCIGGKINVVDYGKFKEGLKDYRNYLRVQIAKTANIKVMLNTEATVELVRSLNPDHLILALGSEPVTPNIKGVEYAQQAIDAYQHMDDYRGKKVIVIGGGAVGAEFAIELAEDMTYCTVVEMGDTLSEKENWLYRIAERQHIRNCGEYFKALMETKVIEIKENGVITVDKNGTEKFIEGDKIVLAVGMKSNSEKCNQFYGITPNTTKIGDAHRVGHVLDATNEAYFIGANIK